MIKTAAELIQRAQQEISCVDVASAKKLFDSAENVFMIDVINKTRYKIDLNCLFK